MKRKTVVIVSILTACIISILFVPTAIRADQKSIKIGFEADFSAVSQAYTHNAFNAAQIAINDFNAEGGLMGTHARIWSESGKLLATGGAHLFCVPRRG